MTTQPVYLVIGCPGSGKSWVCGQLREQYDYLPHDDYMAFPPRTYVEAIIAMQKDARKPVLCETPFSVSQIKDPLEKAGLRVVPVFILEAPHVLRTRYRERENKDIPAGHLTRQETYQQRAADWKAFCGTSLDVLNHLRELSGARHVRPWPWE